MHYNPAEALVDAQQAITPDELKETIDTCQRISKLISPRRNEKSSTTARQ